MLFPSLLVSESANESHLVHLQVQFLVLFWSQCRCNVSSFWVLLEVFCRLIHICIQGTFCIWLTFFGSRHTLKLVSQSQCTTAKFVTADEVANAMNQGCATNVPAHLGNHMNLRTSPESYRRFKWKSLCWFRYYPKYSDISLAVSLGSLIVLSCYSWFVGSDQAAGPPHGSLLRNCEFYLLNPTALKHFIKESISIG